MKYINLYKYTMMKKLFTVLFLFVATFLLSSSVAHATPGVLGTPASDPTASYTPHTGWKYYSTVANGELCQKFKPSRSFVAEYVNLYVAGTQAASSVTLKADNSNRPGEIYSIYNAPASLNDGRNTSTRFTAPTYTQVIPGEYYWLCLTSRNEVWWYADSPWLEHEPPLYGGSYNSGFAWHDSEGVGNEDFGFIVYSMNMEALPDPDPIVPDPVVPDPVIPVVDTTPAADTPLPTGVTAGTGAAPAATTTTIKPASGLAVIDVPSDQGGSLQLTWTASVTTDIDGYKVFRSTTEVTKDFKEIAKTEKNIVTFTDNTAAIGTKYYYMVRAYKTTKESVNSNVVNGVSVDNIAPETPKSPSFKKESNETYTFTWEKNTETDLSGYSLIVVDSNNPTVVLATIDIPKDSSTYSLVIADYQTLATDGAYAFQLTAKDTQANISDAAVVEGVTDTLQETVVDLAETTADKISTTVLWYIAGGSAVLILAIGGGLLYWFKFRKPGVKKVSTPVVEPTVKTPGDIKV